jgi:hypothetical protein
MNIANGYVPANGGLSAKKTLIRKTLIRKIAAAAVLALWTAATLAGCVVINFTDNDNEMGRGPLIEKRFETAPYTEVEIKANIAAVYSKEPSDAVVVEIQENLAEFLHVEVRENRLVVKADREFITNENEMPVLYISAPELTRVQANGAFDFRGGDTVSGEHFEMDVSGSAEIKLDLDVQAFTARLWGGSTARLSGAAEEVRIEISGAGYLDALELDTVRTAIDMQGAGNATVSCSGTLDVSLSGAASLQYRGNPRVTSDVQGAGSVRVLD